MNHNRINGKCFSPIDPNDLLAQVATEQADHGIDISGIDSAFLPSPGDISADFSAKPKPPATKKSIDPVKPAMEWIDRYRAKVESRQWTRLIRTSDAFEGFECGAGLITAIGSGPGTGKTAMIMQLVWDAIANDPDIGPVYIAGNDTNFDTILRREITRMTRVSSDSIRFNSLSDAEHEQVTAAIEQIAPRMENMFVLDPADWLGLHALLEKTPGIVVVDYLQKFTPPDAKDARQGVGQVMTLLRQLANNGWAVLAISAVKRNASGVYCNKSLDLSSFRESSEIEFQIDAGYVLKDMGALENRDYIRAMHLECVKNRNGQLKSFDLRFDRPRMQFAKLEVSLQAEAANPFANPFGEE